MSFLDRPYVYLYLRNSYYYSTEASYHSLGSDFLYPAKRISILTRGVHLDTWSIVDN
jgi:hypothetical protein